MDKEAIRVVSGMPKWIPGMANGKTVRVKYTMPITFYYTSAYNVLWWILTVSSVLSWLFGSNRR